jgi:hypothetical protein
MPAILVSTQKPDGSEQEYVNADSITELRIVGGVPHVFYRDGKGGIATGEVSASEADNFLKHRIGR